MPRISIHKLNYSDYAGRLYQATTAKVMWTDEDEVYQVAREIRSEIAAKLTAKGIVGEKALKEQESLTRKAMEHLGNAYAVLARSKGESVSGSGEGVLHQLLDDEMSGSELTLAESLYGFRNYTETPSEDGWSLAVQVVSGAEGAAAIAFGILLSPFALFGLIPALGGFFYGYHLRQENLENVRQSDPQWIRGESIYPMGEEFYYSHSGFVVNEGKQHYYVDMPAREGEQMLGELAGVAQKEEAWIYIKFWRGGRTFERFVEFGIEEEPSLTYQDTSILMRLVEDPSVQISEIRLYHIHPRGEDILGRNEHFVSPNDIVNTIQLSEAIKERGYKRKLEARAVTPKGVYVLTPKKQISPSDILLGLVRYVFWLDNGIPKREKDAIRAIQKTGLVTARYYYHDRSVALLEAREDRFQFL